MKIQLLLFITIFTPLVVLLSIIRLGAISPTDMKESVAASGAYQQVSDHFAQRDKQLTAEFPLVDVVVSKLITPAFIQSKTESTIDVTAGWMNGKTDQRPTVSLKELKDELQTQHPEVLNALSYIPTALDFLKAHLNIQDQTNYIQQSKQINTFINTDFMLPIARQLDAVKFIYGLIPFVLPVLLILIIVSYFVLIKIAKDRSNSYTWAGASLLASSLFGILLCLLYPYALMYFAGSRIIQESLFLTLFSPIILAIISYILGVYSLYQGILSSLFIVLAAICFWMAHRIKNQLTPVTKPVYEEKSYWETPEKDTPAKSNPEQDKVAD